ASATGSFVFDATKNWPFNLSNWNVSTTAGKLSAFNYVPNDSNVPGSFQSVVYFLSNQTFPTMGFNEPRILKLVFAAPLTNAAGTVNLATGLDGGLECLGCVPIRYITSGSVVGSTATIGPVGSAVTTATAAVVEANPNGDTVVNLRGLAPTDAPTLTDQI